MLDGQRKFSLAGVTQQRGCSGNRSDDACAVCFASGVMVGPDQTEKKSMFHKCDKLCQMCLQIVQTVVQLKCMTVHFMSKLIHMFG
mgnify:CR=1 FL=1